MVILTGPSTVYTGTTVSYTLELGGHEGDDDALFHLVAEVPAGWTLQSSSYTGTVSGQPVSGDLSPTGGGSHCLSAGRPGFQQILFVAGPFTTVETDSAQVNLEFFVSSQPEGVYAAVFRFRSEGALGAPCGEAERIINADPWESVVREIVDSFAEGFGLASPPAIAVDSDGTAYVTGNASGNVLRISAAGAVAQILDETGDGEGRTLAAPGDVVVDETGNVFVSGIESDNVFRVSPAGEITEVLDATGDGVQTLHRPWGLAVDAGGNLFVMGRSSRNVFRVTPDGEITEILGSTGDGSSSFGAGLELAVDAAGNVYAAGGTTNNVFKITPEGAVEEIVDVTGDGEGGFLLNAGGLAVDPFGNVFVAGIQSDNVLRIGPDGSITEVLDSEGGGHGLDVPWSVASDEDGNVYVSGWNTANVLRLEPSGGIRQIVNTLGNGIGGELRAPTGVAARRGRGAYVVGEYSGNALHWTDPVFADGFEAGNVSRWQ